MDLQDTDKVFACSLCGASFPSQSLFISHRISSFHIKKLKTKYLRHDFLVECLACNVFLSDLKQSHAHMQLPQHKDRMKVFLKQGPSANYEFICESCGFSFRNQVALELHQTLPPHQLALSLSNLPNFHELVKHLGGLPTNFSEPTCSCSCRVCNEEYGRLDEFVLHLFSKLHIRLLRQSACIICRKDFIHASDRELHLASSKHKSLLCVSVWELLRKMQDRATFNNWGYSCMYCMIWCSSWPCFELHLLHNPHYEAVLKRKSNQPRPTILKEDDLPEGKEDLSLCEELTSTNWRRWREEPAGLSGWCHSCGTVLAFPDKAESHLEDHHLGKICEAGKSHPAVPIADSKSANIFRCYACCISFGSAFSLVVHEALRQHHLRIATQSFSEHQYWCANCGINAIGVKCMQLKISPINAQPPQMSSESIMKVDKSQLSFSENLCDSGAVGICHPDSLESQSLQREEMCKKLRDFGSSSLHVPSGTLFDAKKTSCEEGVKPDSLESQSLQREEMCKKLGDFGSSSSHVPSGTLLDVKKTRCEEGIKILGALQPEDQATNSALARRHAKNRNVSRKELVDNGSTFSSAECRQAEDASRGTGGITEKICADRSGIIPPLLGPDTVTSCVESKDNLQSPLLLVNQSDNIPGKVTDSSGNAHHTSFGVPIVAAAILSPSESLQEALRSVMTVVVDTLSATLPMLQASSTSCSGNCRKHEQELHDTLEPDSKRLRLEKAVLEAALQQGFQALRSRPSLLVDTSAGIEKTGGNLQPLCGNSPCIHSDPSQRRRTDANCSLQPNIDNYSIPNLRVDTSDGTADHVSGSAADNNNCVVHNSISLMTRNVQHVASVVVAAAVVPYTSAAPAACVGNANNAPCAVSEIKEKECLCNHKHEAKSIVGNSDGAMQVHTDGSPCKVDKVDEMKVENRRLEDEAHKQQDFVLTKQISSKSRASFTHKDTCTMQACRFVSSSSISTEDEIASDSGSDDLFPPQTCVKVLQTSNLSASDTEDSSESKRESDY